MEERPSHVVYTLTSTIADGKYFELCFRKLDINAENDSWSQNKPKTDTNVGGPGTGGPPILPPQLLNILLNKEHSERTDPVLLPEPSTHVSFKNQNSSNFNLIIK